MDHQPHDGTSSARQVPVSEPLLLAGVGILAVALVGWAQPRYPELFPTCPSRTLFGVYCPLCGGTRAVAALSAGRPLEAVGHNAFVPPVAALAGWSWLAWLDRVRGPARLPSVPRPVWWVVGVGWLAYGVLRNLPALAVLAP